MLPIAGIKFVIGWRPHPTRDAEQGAKGIEGVKATVEAKSEFVEVDLYMLRADAVMYADQPRLEIGKDEMNDGQELVHHLGISTLGNRVVVVAAFS